MVMIMLVYNLLGHSRIDKLEHGCILPSILAESTGKMELNQNLGMA